MPGGGIVSQVEPQCPVSAGRQVPCQLRESKISHFLRVLTRRKRRLLGEVIKAKSKLPLELVLFVYVGTPNLERPFDKHIDNDELNALVPWSAETGQKLPGLSPEAEPGVRASSTDMGLRPMPPHQKREASALNWRDMVRPPGCLINQKPLAIRSPNPDHNPHKEDRADETQ